MGRAVVPGRDRLGDMVPSLGVRAGSSVCQPPSPFRYVGVLVVERDRECPNPCSLLAFQNSGSLPPPNPQM